MKKRLISLIFTFLMLLVFVPVSVNAGETSTEPEYAWVLAEINDYENADKWATSDAHESYIVTHGYSRGVYSASTTYEGADPYGQGLGGTLAVQAVFSGIPDIIYPNEPVSLKFTFAPSENSVVKLAFSSSAGASFDQWDVPPGGATGSAITFKNADGEDGFKITAQNSESYDETITATLGSGNENSRIALKLGFYMGVSMGTNYVYEWKPVAGYSPHQGSLTADPTSAPKTTTESSEDQPDLYSWERTWEDNRTRTDIRDKSEFWIKWAEQARQWTPDEIEAVQKTPSIVKIGDLTGETWVLRGWEEDIDQAFYAELDTPLYHGDLIITRRRSGALLSFSDMSSFVIKENTSVILDIKNERESKIALVAGNVWINLKKMIQDGSMEVEMSQGVAGIKGTILAASVTDNGDEFYLFTSSADVTSKVTGETVTLIPGQKALIDQAGDIKVGKFDMTNQAKAFDISMSDLEADGYKRNQGSWLVWVLLILVVAIVAIAVTLLLRKNKMKAMAAQSTNRIPASPYGQANPTSTIQNAYCPNCGNPVSNDQRFCQHCGKQI